MRASTSYQLGQNDITVDCEFSVLLSTIKSSRFNQSIKNVQHKKLFTIKKAGFFTRLPSFNIKCRCYGGGGVPFMNMYSTKKVMSET